MTIGRNFGQLGCDGAFESQIGNEWGARIGERKTNRPRTGQRAANLHQRNQGDRLAGAIEPQVKWFVTVGSSQHPRPSGSMKRSRVRKWSKKRIPFAVFQRIGDRQVDVCFRSRSLGCHVERSETSLTIFLLSEDDRRFFASLRMT